MRKGAPIETPFWCRASVFSCIFSLAVLSLLACETKLSEEEAAFHQRADTIRVGSTREEVKKAIGEPSRILEADQECRSVDGVRELVYESFDSPTGKASLRTGSFVLCVDERGTVKNKIRVYK